MKRFSRGFQEHLKIDLKQAKVGSQIKASDLVVGNRNHAMRFSFEKPMSGGNNGKRLMQEEIHPLM